MADFLEVISVETKHASMVLVAGIQSMMLKNSACIVKQCGKEQGKQTKRSVTKLANFVTKP
jgi:archaellin